MMLHGIVSMIPSAWEKFSELVEFYGLIKEVA
jgi:hypothetical protein